ncbi:hypothetical protein IDH44_16330 [Paenibacillus sp. IB182496]|uniref:Uncharacterized protein n=2 Tax=Paenibacillus sabuli TaxID=2772509 RepID=A0A927GT65_9BACL|nr:YheC/YheD family protein [Paenibacillus sabuli]MBD2846765.1 hypothetical protein [Paenibacillus sabuli]
MAKIARKDKNVNNHYQGGEVVTLRRLMRKKGAGASAANALQNRLQGASLRIARALSKRRAGMHEMGIDFGVDAGRRIRVIEVNSNHPQFHPLKTPDRAMYDRMLSYARSYGRKTAR